VDWVDVSTPTTRGPSAADIGLSLFRGSRVLTWILGRVWGDVGGVPPLGDIFSLPRDATAY